MMIISISLLRLPLPLVLLQYYVCDHRCVLRVLWRFYT